RCRPLLLPRPPRDLAIPSFPTRRSSDLADHPELRHLMPAHAACPAPRRNRAVARVARAVAGLLVRIQLGEGRSGMQAVEHRDRVDRKSTRLNSSHVKISYAVFCLKKKRA